MQLAQPTLSRVGKFFVDRDGAMPEDAAALLRGYRLVLACGPEVAKSSTLQAAALTIANQFARTFGHAPTISWSPGHGDGPLLVPGSAVSLGAALRALPLELSPAPAPETGVTVIVLGTRPDVPDGLQVTFDGWSAGVAPSNFGFRMAENDRCVLAGVLAGSLAVAEIFFRVARVHPAAGMRQVRLSLWRPDLSPDSSEAVGPMVEWLPGECWCLGLGHLGQASMWALGMLPYQEPERVRLLLNDFDIAKHENLETQVLMWPRHLRLPKGVAVEEFLRDRGFRPLRLDRRFDERTRVQEDEPSLALCGFDGQGPRHLLDDVFDFVVECGVGGRTDNFDAIQLHTLPHPTQPARVLWPLQEVADNPIAERLAERAPFYQRVKQIHGCGQVDLAGQSVAVPFVGGVASSLALAETLRMLHGGIRCLSLDVRLDSVEFLATRIESEGYSPQRRPRTAHAPLPARRMEA